MSRSQKRSSEQLNRSSEQNPRFPAPWRPFDRFRQPCGQFPNFPPPPPLFVHPSCGDNESFRSDFYCVGLQLGPVNCGSRFESFCPFCSGQFGSSTGFDEQCNEFRCHQPNERIYGPLCQQFDYQLSNERCQSSSENANNCNGRRLPGPYFMNGFDWNPEK